MAICVKLDTVAEARIARKDPLISPHCPSESLILVKKITGLTNGGQPTVVATTGYSTLSANLITGDQWQRGRLIVGIVGGLI